MRLCGQSDCLYRSGLLPSKSESIALRGKQKELMRKQAIQRRRLPLILLALPLLNGCLVHTRSVKRATMPSVVMTATADQLIKVVNDRCKEIHSLSTTVN